MSPDERQKLAERLAPVLVLWPEIPAATNGGASTRDRFSRQEIKSSTRKVSGAHIVRDYHPRDVRLILQNARAYEPRPPLPMVGVSFARAYRDMASWFFWPILLLVALALILVALATGLDRDVRLALQISIFVILSGVWLATFRSPVKVPTNHWHLINHTLVGTGLGLTWVAIIGPNYLLVPIIIGIPWLSSTASWVLIKVRWLASAPLRLARAVKRGHVTDVWTSFAGSKAAQRYTRDSEMFFVYPGSSAAMHRSDRAAHWTAYSQIMGSPNQYTHACYAKVLDPDPDGVTVIQYWFCYYYDDWANEHEGDWESLVVLARDGQPLAAAASAHEAGEYRDWQDIETSYGRPVLYVAAGSHALYFTPGVRTTQRAVLGLEVSTMDASLLGRSEINYMDFAPSSAEEAETVRDIKVVLIPETDPVTGLWTHAEHDGPCESPCLYDPAWLNYAGTWGGRASMGGGGSGPFGPAWAGLRWNDPRLWAELVCKRYEEKREQLEPVEAVGQPAPAQKAGVSR